MLWTTTRCAMWLALGALAARAAASEIKPKNIDISLSAKWSVTPVAAEAAEFMAEEGSSVFWDFVSGLADSSLVSEVVRAGGGSDREQLEAVEAVGSSLSLVSPLGLRLMRSMLAAHVFSPRVEMWRQVAAKEAERDGVPSSALTWLSVCAQAFSATDSSELDGALDGALAAAASPDCTAATPLSVDHLYGSPGAGAPTLVLYAPLGSDAFAKLHPRLVAAADAGRVTYVYRPLVVSTHTRQTLQGYGVQLAIKNMEYKAMDDAQIKDLGGIGEGEEAAAADEPDETEEGSDEGGSEEGGFFFRTLRARRPELREGLRSFQEELASAEAADEGALKVWAMQGLGLQASARVLSSKAPLETLRDLCQNFPFVARSLSRTRPDPEIEAAVELVQGTFWGQGYSGAFLNGRALPVVHKNELAGLLRKLQKELHVVDAFSQMGLPSEAIRKLVSLPAPSASMRVNVKHPAVFILNDIAKDKQYQRWPSSVRELLRQNMFGQISFIRRNVFTMVFVVDPATELGLDTIGFLHNIYEQEAPIRIAIVLAPGVSRRKTGIAHPSPFLDGGSRLRSLAEVYELPEWHQLAGLEQEANQYTAAAGAAEGAEPSSASAAAPAAPASEEERHAESLGVLLTKLFIFCKRKLGNRAAMRFLGLTREVRESGGGFFGPPQVDPLNEAHLQAAFQHTVSATKKQIDTGSIFAGLSSGELDDFDEEVAAGERFVASKGLNELPLLLVNGVFTKLSENLEQEVMGALGAEYRQVTELVRAGKISEDTQDFISAIANATTTFSRYNRELLLPSDKISVLPLRAHEALSQLSWLHSSAAQPGETASFCPVSIIYVLDLCDPTHVILAGHALKALEASAAGDEQLRLRISVLHHPSAATADADSVAAAAAWSRLASGPEPIPLLRRWLAMQLLSLRANTSLAALLGSERGASLSPLLPAGFAADLAAEHDATAALLASHAQLCATLGLAAGAAAVIANGRHVEAAELDDVDLQLLAQFEWKQRAQGAAELIEFVAAEAPAGAGAEWRSDLQQLAVAEASRAAAQPSAAAHGEPVFSQDDIPCGASCVRLPGSGPGEALELLVILDPLSKEAQRFTPILIALHQALGLSVVLHLNPIVKISEFPLESFYRYVVNLEPIFDAAGHSLAHQADHAVFSSLRTPAVLTLHVDAPEAWLIECTEAAHDMDNIKLSELGEHKKTVSAAYELASLLVTGSCEDVGQGKPPNGLQLLLGTATERHVTDTLVMSNLGYFQLKAAPGLWQVELAPGPSSEVYSIQAAEGDELQAAEQQQVVLAGFEGEFVTLLVRKKAGMEHASILDNVDKKPPPGPRAAQADADEPAGVLDGLAKWWSGGLKGDDKNGETVHIFSLASGHLYERFLRIMMQSVLDRTDRPVKFWLLKNFLSPAFIGVLPAMAQSLGFEYGLVQYQWPSWLHKQTNKQRIIWGYKILFLDVMFPLNVRKIIYIDADQVVNADVGELWDMGLGRAAVGMTPFCQADENPDTTGFRFFAQGYWRDHLQGRPYHISALFVVDLFKFRRRAYGDQYRILYDSLSRDPNSLSNLDQDLPNYAQHLVPIYSLPESWLWCETWCGNASKAAAKTIDLCNNPLTKEPKLNQAGRIIGDRWSLYDNRSKALDEQPQAQQPAEGVPTTKQGAKLSAEPEDKPEL